MDLERIFRACEDHFFRALDVSVHERVVYYHLLRHTHLEGQPSTTLSLGKLASGVGLSDTTVREAIRSLDQRGCIRIEERSRLGHLVTVFLPSQVAGGVPMPASAEPELASLDFFTNRRFVAALLERESGRCFYCQKQLTVNSCTLDHVRSQVTGLDNSYRNIVAACHECNTLKQSTAADEFLRSLYRRSVLSQSDLAERLQALERLSAGELRPSAEAIRAAI